jgi:hypothetical protein
MGIYAFIIHSAENVGSVYFSHFYTSEGNDTLHVTRQQAIIRKVLEDKSFQQQSVSFFPTRLDMRVISTATMNSLNTTKRVSDCYPSTTSHTHAIPAPLEGVTFIQPTGELFANNMTAIWRQYEDIIFTAVCDMGDNLTVVANDLILIVEEVVRRYGVKKLDEKIVNEPDGIEAIIVSFFRQGNPLIINHSLHRFLIGIDDDTRSSPIL